MDRISINSSALVSVGYDAKTQILEVEFPNGDVYQYSGVSKSTVDAMNAASSVGSYFMREIRSHYRGIKV